MDDSSTEHRFEVGEPAVLVLISVAGGPRRGSAVAADVGSFAGIRLGERTVRELLRVLEQQGLIAQSHRGAEAPYRITETGEAELAGNLARMRTVLTTGTGRLGVAAALEPPAAGDSATTQGDPGTA